MFHFFLIAKFCSPKKATWQYRDSALAFSLPSPYTPDALCLLFSEHTGYATAMEDFYDVLLKKVKEDDFYALLGCDELATTEQINAEFRQKAKLHHPDKKPGDKTAEKLFERFVRHSLVDLVRHRRN